MLRFVILKKVDKHGLMLFQSRHKILTQVKVSLQHEVASLFHEVLSCIPQACLYHWHPQQTLCQMTEKNNR